MYAAAAAAGPDRALVWNLPLDVTFKSTNAFGWPQLVVSVFGLDAFGRDVVKGYGCTHLPTAAGRCASGPIQAAAHGAALPRTGQDQAPKPAAKLPCPHRYSLKVRLFRPQSASLLQRATAWVTGMAPEFSDPRFPAYSEGREGAHGVLSEAGRQPGVSLAQQHGCRTPAERAPP